MWWISYRGEGKSGVENIGVFEDEGRRVVLQDRKMTRLPHNPTALLAALFVTAVAQPPAAAAEPSAGAQGVQAEIQIGLCTPTDEIVQALALRPRGTPITVWQFDDTALTLLGRGLRLRLRVAADGRAVLTLKVANQDCALLDPQLVPRTEGKCEYDVYGKTMAGAVSLNVSLDAKSTDDLLAGRVEPAQVLSPSQVRYLREIARVWPLPPGIRKLGPMQVRTFRTKGGSYDIDISRLPDGAQYAEISRKVPLGDASRTMGAMQADLARAGVEMCADTSSQAVTKLRSLLR